VSPFSCLSNENGGLFVAIVLTIVLWAPIAHAQAVSQDTLDRIDRTRQTIERDQAERRRADELLRQRNRRSIGPSIAPPRSTLEALAADTDRCFTVRRLKITGSQALGAEALQEVAARYEGKCLDFAKINEIVRALTNLYVSKGFITSRAYLTPQDLSSGTLEITVVEGKLEGYRYFRNETDQKRVDNAFPPHDVAEPLNLRKIEQGLDNINRVPKAQARMNIQPGEEDGTSAVIVEIDQPSKVQAFTTTHNRGLKTTGQYQQTAGIYFGDVFNGFETIRITGGQDLHNGDIDEASRYVSVGLGVPYGNLFFDVSGYYSDYSTVVVGNAQSFVSSGDTQAISATLDYMVHRDQFSKTTLAASLSLKETENFIDDNLIGVSSRRLASLILSASHATTFAGGALGGSVFLEQGLDAFGALEDPSGISRRDPQAQYTLAALDIGYQKALSDVPVIWDVALSAQYAFTGLFGSEQFNIGSDGTVRGFQQDSIGGDHGVYLRNELIAPLEGFSDTRMAEIFGGTSVFAAFDIGAASDVSFERVETLAGLSAGMRFSGGNVYGSVGVHQSIIRPDFLNDEGTLLNFEIGLVW